MLLMPCLIYPVHGIYNNIHSSRMYCPRILPFLFYFMMLVHSNNASKKEGQGEYLKKRELSPLEAQLKHPLTVADVRIYGAAAWESRSLSVVIYFYEEDNASPPAEVKWTLEMISKESSEMIALVTTSMSTQDEKDSLQSVTLTGKPTTVPANWEPFLIVKASAYDKVFIQITWHVDYVQTDEVTQEVPEKQLRTVRYIREFAPVFTQICLAKPKDSTEVIMPAHEQLDETMFRDR